jgi:hypothetical protein
MILVEEPPLRMKRVCKRGELAAQYLDLLVRQHSYPGKIPLLVIKIDLLPAEAKA